MKQEPGVFVKKCFKYHREAAEEQDSLITKASESFTEVNGNVGQLIADIGEIDNMLNGLSEANNQIVENIMHLSATTEEVTASAQQSTAMTESNFEDALNAHELLAGVMEVSYRLDKYMS